MLLIDTYLARRSAQGRPIQVGIVGAGTLGGAIAHQVLCHTKGMTVAAIANRHPEKAKQVLERAKVPDPSFVSSVSDLETNLRSGRPSFTDNPDLLCEADGIDVIVEVTGTIEYGSRVCLHAFEHRKPVILVNAELEATLGPILKEEAQRAGVVFSGSDGDQPGVTLNLYRFVQGLGLKPLLCGNIKGLHDTYRTPETQAEFARKWDQNVNMVTSFADGTKISFEQAVTANATGMTVAQRGMLGRDWNRHVDELTETYNADELDQLGGVVDYVVGAQPGPGVFVFGATDDPFIKKNLKLYKLGDGPLYSFYTPYHLCFLEVPNSIARVVEFQDVVTAPIDAPKVDVIAVAKKQLHAGEILDGIGGFTVYGQAEKSSLARAENLLPMGLAEKCRLIRDIPRDTALTFDDIVLPVGRLCDRLWLEQCARFHNPNIPVTPAPA